MPGTVFTPIQTARLLLRPLAASDAPAFSEYRSVPEVAIYQGWDVPYTLGRAVDFVSQMGRAFPGRAGEWYQVAIELKSQHLLIGDIGLKVLPDGRQGEIGFTLAAQHQGKGYALEAVGRVVDYMFMQLDLHRIQANCDPRNARSIRLMRRLGMRREGHTVESLWFKGEWVDELWYAVLRRDWQAPPGAVAAQSVLGINPAPAR